MSISRSFLLVSSLITCLLTVFCIDFTTFPFLEGATAIRPNRAIENASETYKANCTTDYAEITIDNSAEIYVLFNLGNPSKTYMDWITTDGYQKVSDSYVCLHSKTETYYRYYAFKKTINLK
ncbi:MAG: hypothetical protein J6Q67_05905, partial [Clostridia bacterium]|nr:hypothetical protein [Clostridia bacterium]